MPHQCVKCSRIIPVGSQELLSGCKDCGSRFFFYVKEEHIDRLKVHPMIELPQKEKDQIEKDVRKMAGIVDEEAPVILDFESVRAVGDGKFEIDIVNLFQKERPVVYQMEEGKYIIDIAFSLSKQKDKKEE